MLFSVLEEGEVFGHFSHIFAAFNVSSPFTVKTNEKTRYIQISAEAVQRYCKDYLIEQFTFKYDFMKNLKCLGDTKNSFSRMLPIVAVAKFLSVPKNTLIIK